MNVNIDFTKNNIKVGYINENISTTLDIAIPEDMIDGSYKYRVVFQVHRFEQYKSDFVELDDNNHIIYKIPNVVAIKPTIDMQVVAYDESDGMVRKSKTVTLVFDKSVIGRDFIVDPFRNQVKVAELTWDIYDKTNMSSKKLIEYVKQDFFITVQGKIVEVYDINEEENFIIFYHLVVMNGNITGIAFLTVRDNIIDITIRNIDFSATIDSIKYDEDHSLHWKLDEIDTQITNGQQTFETIIPQIESNTQARHTHTNKTLLDKISEGSNENLYYNGQEYYNAADVEQAIISAEGDLIEIYSSGGVLGQKSRYKGSELYTFGSASKGFSYKGTPVVNWFTTGMANNFYFQCVHQTSVSGNLTVFVALVDEDKNILIQYDYEKAVINKINGKSFSNVTLFPEDIVAANFDWEPTEDGQLATKYYVDKKIGLDNNGYYIEV